MGNYKEEIYGHIDLKGADVLITLHQRDNPSRVSGIIFYRVEVGLPVRYTVSLNQLHEFEPFNYPHFKRLVKIILN